MTGSFLSISIAPIVQTAGNGNSFQASSRLLKKWNIKENTTVILKIGKKEMNVEVHSAEIPLSEINFSTQLLNEFYLPNREHKFLAKYISEKNTLQLGPIVGLLTDFQLNDNNEPDFRSIHAFCEELHHGLFSLGGFFYVFQLSDYSNSTIKGYYFSDGEWTFGELPLPDVIYNRIHSRKLECMENFRSVLQRVSNLHIPIFNERFLSKWEVHNRLMQEEHMHPYLPETILFS
ncbi:MAG: YheC/YheD family protein, partial [Bacillota bacterium]|nr:YheC/YheD family protein [Bacillota bacterium]